MNSFEQNKTVAFTGHRDLYHNREAIKKITADAVFRLIESGYDCFLNGVAFGFDLLAAECVLELKTKHPDIRLIACVPCKNQQERYPRFEKERYEKVLNAADEVIYVSEEYSKGCMLKRDRFMVDRASIVLAYYVTETGGTDYTVKYAQSHSVAVLNIAEVLKEV